jgi:hypothetical protein
MGHTRAHIRPFGGRHPLRTNCVRPCWSGAPPRGHGGHRRRGVALVRSFEADDVSKELNEQAALDELIDVLLSAKSQQEVRALCTVQSTPYAPGSHTYPRSWFQVLNYAVDWAWQSIVLGSHAQYTMGRHPP